MTPESKKIIRGLIRAAINRTKTKQQVIASSKKITEEMMQIVALFARRRLYRG